MVIAGTFLTVFITICRDLIQGTAKHYKLPLIGLVAAMIAVMLEVTEVYRVVSMSGIFIATGLVVLLVVTLIQTMDRISELTRIARERDLTPEEQAERKALREEYLADWRRSTIDVLENTYIDHGDGRITKLPKKKR